ncbi:MAG: hypothetical protein LBM70_06455 [Victivallales bacterium]|nr:hypothetical protein [Victivallales bacterium]
MKKLLFGVALLCGVVLNAAPQYTINYGSKTANGGITVNEDLSSMTLTSDFGNVGGGGSIGYYVYGDDVKDYTPGGELFGKSDSKINIGSLNAGDNIGFFLKRSNGSIVTQFHFEENQNGLFLVFDKGNSGRSETVQIGEITTVDFSDGGGGLSGQPLPGVVAAFLSGGAVWGIVQLRRKKQRRA